MSAEEKPRRLCSEIQLFDLCAKTVCKNKDGRFCTDETVLQKFEAISQEDDFPTEQYLVEEGDDGEVSGDEEEQAFPGYSEDYDDDEEDYDDEP